MMKVSDKSFKDDLKTCIKEKNNRFVIFCLDNSSQIEKLMDRIKVLGFDKGFENINRVALIHDESDTITKDHDIVNIYKDQAESHKMWIELAQLFNTSLGTIDLKRIFVTATPENCVMLYNIDNVDVMKLEIPNSYQGHNDLEYNILEDDIDIKQILKDEVKRIKDDETCEIILYCIDRKIADGQDIVLKSLASNLKCTVNTYNGNGITVIFKTATKTKLFEKELKSRKIKYIIDSNTVTIKSLAIRTFYTMCKKIGERCVVTIGKDLIARGISYVSEDEIHPMTATTIIYKPGTSMHAVGICQTIGRITGCAMPELKRRVYAPADVIETYKSYNKNQELYIKKIEASKTVQLTKDIIANTEFEKCPRSIDRAKLQLKMKYATVPIEFVDVGRMKELVNMWWGKQTIIGKILKFVYDSKTGVSEVELKEFIKTLDSSNINELYNELIRQKRGHSLIFKRLNHLTTVNTEVKKYIENM